MEETKKIDLLTEEFKAKYERFMIGCDAAEEGLQWDEEEYGSMEGFYQNDLISVILRLIAADGRIADEEVDYLNESFGFQYTTEELIDVYEECREGIDRLFEEQFAEGMTLLRSVDEALADAYVELLDLIFDIIIESDGVVAQREIEEARRLKDML